MIFIVINKELRNLLVMERGYSVYLNILKKKLLGLKMNYLKIKSEIQKFVDERNWEDSHTPKNLAMALSVEASELVEIFTWLKDDENLYKSNEIKIKTQEELVDIFYYIVRICQKMDINLEEAFYEKMKKNTIKHPKPN